MPRLTKDTHTPTGQLGIPNVTINTVEAQSPSSSESYREGDGGTLMPPECSACHSSLSSYPSTGSLVAERGRRPSPHGSRVWALPTYARQRGMQQAHSEEALPTALKNRKTSTMKRSIINPAVKVIRKVKSLISLSAPVVVENTPLYNRSLNLVRTLHDRSMQSASANHTPSPMPPQPETTTHTGTSQSSPTDRTQSRTRLSEDNDWTPDPCPSVYSRFMDGIVNRISLDSGSKMPKVDITGRTERLYKWLREVYGHTEDEIQRETWNRIREGDRAEMSTPPDWHDILEPNLPCWDTESGINTMLSTFNQGAADRPPTPPGEYLTAIARPCTYVPISTTCAPTFPGWVPPPDSSPSFSTPLAHTQSLSTPSLSRNQAPLVDPTPHTGTSHQRGNNGGNGGVGRQSGRHRNDAFMPFDKHSHRPVGGPPQSSVLPQPVAHPHGARSSHRRPSEPVTYTDSAHHQARSPPLPHCTPTTLAHTSGGPSTVPPDTTGGRYIVNYQEGALEEGMASELPRDLPRSTVYVAEGFGCFIKVGEDCFISLRPYVPFIAIECRGGFVVYNTANGELATELVARQWLLWIHNIMTAKQIDLAVRDFKNRADWPRRLRYLLGVFNAPGSEEVVSKIQCPLHRRDDFSPQSSLVVVYLSKTNIIIYEASGRRMVASSTASHFHEHASTHASVEHPVAMSSDRQGLTKEPQTCREL
ncbi:hypothetical protein FA13DRAFT_1713807 [Coprinellus micaceus]|uniref:Uncharacterized protein n=1 Tax=Coprinellus micaceus TaxID=71717 RepID=A0A4Y7SWY9_COPMI|nr:hypothetical protein FA13DRAFT_1713807 [Coprinellus micaceus]